MRAFTVFLLFTFTLLQNPCNAQEEIKNPYTPLDMESFELYINHISKKYNNNFTGIHSRKIVKRLKDRPDYILENIKDSLYYFEPKLQEEVAKVLSHIYSSNPSINSTDFKFLIKNSIIPNAGAYGDGLFEINLGLLSLYETEDELAMVICHEIAHKELRHSINRLQKSTENYYSEETQRTKKKIKKLKYGRTRASMALLDELRLDILKHSKDTEAQADSLGMIYFRNTNFNQTQALRALEKLDTVDEQLLSYPFPLDSVFNFKLYPFKKYWLEEEISLFDLDERINDFSVQSDSVKTHPEITYRVKKLKHEFSVDTITQQTSKNSFSEIKTLAIAQKLQYTLDKKNYDLSLYLINEMYGTNDISTEVYAGNLAFILYKIHQAKKDHSLGKSIAPYNRYSDEKQLNTIRLFLQNIESKELEKMSYAFCEKYKSIAQENIRFQKAYTYFKN